MVCTVAAIIAALGYMPPRNTEIIVPRSALGKYTPAQQRKAEACARKYGIKWRVADQ